MKALPPSAPTVEDGRLAIANHVVILENGFVTVQGSWERREYMDFTSWHCAKLGWLADALHLNTKEDGQHTGEAPTPG